MNRRQVLAAVATGIMTFVAPAWAPAWAAAAEAHVLTSQYCGCCGGWVDHMRANGLEVTWSRRGSTPQRRRRASA